MEIVNSNTLIFALRRFSERRFIYPAEDIAGAVSDINMTWGMFNSSHAEYVDRMFEALSAEYKPLENYSMIEEGTDDRTISRTTGGTRSTQGSNTLEKTGTVSTEGTTSGTNTRTDDLTSETKNTGTISTEATTTAKTADTTTRTTKNTGTQTSAGTDGTTNSVAAYDSEAYAARDKQDKTTSGTRTDDLTETTTNGGEMNSDGTSASTQTNDTTDTTTNTGTQSTEQSGTSSSTLTNNTTDTTTTNSTETSSGTESGTDGTKHRLSRAGNIGVTTSQQMLTSELFLRARNQLAYYVIELFVSQFTTW